MNATQPLTATYSPSDIQGFTTSLCTDPAQLPDAWDALLAASERPSPFMRRTYLSDLHHSASATPKTGWAPQFILLWRDTDNGAQLAAACPLYIKPHSRGEYVFDHAWAGAYAQHGLDYYPKLVCAVPFTPVMGSRLLAVDDAARAALLQTLQHHAKSVGASSVHILFGSLADHTAATTAGWAQRHTVQFHWQNPGAHLATDYESFLKTLAQPKAKKARAEMRKVREAGLVWRAVAGADASTVNIDLLIQCYTQTYHEHGNAPYLSPDFFKRQFTSCPAHWVLFIASHTDHGDLACSLIGLDPEAKVAYGRYWGALGRVDSLHFDACYHQPLSWCIAQGYVRFEGGAQGEHKMARGLLPVQAQSSHYIADTEFAKAILRFTERELLGVAGYLDELQAHSPMRAGAVASA